MNKVEELLRRQSELEDAMKQRGGARVTDEHELQDVKRKIAAMTTPSSIANDPASARALRCSLADFAAAAGGQKP